MRPRRSPPPLWFAIGVAVAAGLAARACVAALAPASGDGHGAPLSYAFWGFFVQLIGIIWDGIQVAGEVTLNVLQWIVAHLSILVARLVNGLKWVGRNLLDGLHKVWTFARLTYDKVIKPAWEKFWRWFDRFRQWLDHTFGPVLKFLHRLTDSLMRFWKDYVRPWLDLIDVTRRVLRVLGSLGLRWARELDARLGAIEEAIERPFRMLLQKAERRHQHRQPGCDAGRVAATRRADSLLERDYIFAWRSAVNPWIKPRDDAADIRKARDDRRQFLETVITNTQQYMRDGSGPRAAALDEMALIWRNYLVKR
jgi:hypothetical protein